MKRCVKRVLSLVLAAALVLGMTSVSALADDTTSDTTETVSVELTIGDTVTYTVDGEYTSADDDTDSIDTTVAAAEISVKEGVTADGGSYYLHYTRGDYTYYLTFAVNDSALTIGTVTSYDSATPVTYGTDSSLSFSSDGTTYYLNNTSGTALTADADMSTTWSYNTTAGFYCTIGSVQYYLSSFAGYVTDFTSPGSAAPSGSTMISYAVVSSGIYTLSLTEDDVTKYLSLSVDTSTGALTSSVTETADDATSLTFNGNRLTFTCDSTTYYLDINSGSLVASTSSTSNYAAAWMYDPTVGFLCTKGSTYYMMFSYDSSTESYSLILSTSGTAGTDQVSPTVNATTDIKFRLKLGGYFLALSGSTGSLTTLSHTYSGATTFSYTADGYLSFADNGTTYYLVVSNESSLSVTSEKEEASVVYFKIPNGSNSKWTYGFTFPYTDGDSTSSMYLSGSHITASSYQTEIKLTGVGVGTTSVTVGGVKYEITVCTKIITLHVGDTYVAGVEGEYTSSNLSGLDTSIATADFDDTTVGYENADVSAGSSTAYMLSYKTGGVTFYFTLDYDSSSGSLTTGSVTNYYSGTGVTFEEDSDSDTSTGYLKFTGSDGNSYYLNVDESGALTASETTGTVWTYSSTDGFTCTVSDSDDSTSTLYLLNLLAATNPGGTVLQPVYSITFGSYVLQYTGTTTEDGTTTSTTYYLTFSMSDSVLTVGTADSSTSGTTVTYTTDGYLSFTSGGTTYYLYVTEDGSLSADAASSDSVPSNAAVWSYSQSTGFSCAAAGSGSSTTYYLSGTTVSTNSDISVVTYTATTDLSFALGYADDSFTYSVLFSLSSYAVSSLSTTSYSASNSKASYQVTYTADGYLKNYWEYYLNISEDGTISMSETASTVWSFDPDEGFYYTDSDDVWYLTDFLAFTSGSSTAVDAHGQTSGTAGTAITFTGVAAGTTTATLSSTDSTYMYKIIVLDEPQYVTSETSPFIGSTVTNSTYSGTYSTITDAGYAGYPVSGIYLSLGLNYAITLNTDSEISESSGSNRVVVAAGGTWTIADGSVATFSDGSTSLTDSEGTAVTITGVAAGETTLTYTTTDGVSYTIPVTIKDFWGYASASSTKIKTYEFYVTEITSTTTYMAVLYGEDNDSVSSADFLEVTEGEVVYISFPYNAATAVDYFGTPDEGYALTLLGSTNSNSHYMTLDSDNPGETEFANLVTAAGYNQIYSYGSASVFNVIQAALDYDSDGGMGFTRPQASTSNAVSMITVRSQKLPTVDKEITSITRTSTDANNTTTKSTIAYTEGMTIHEGDVINYTVTVTQYATTEAITYTNEVLSDSLRVKIYLVLTIEDDTSAAVTAASTTDADAATEVTFTASGDDASTGYLKAVIGGTEYYLYLNSSAELCAEEVTDSTPSSAGRWSYNLGTGLSYTLSGTDGITDTSTTYYLSGSAVTTTSGENVVSILQADNDSCVLGYSGISTYMTYTYSDGTVSVGSAAATEATETTAAVAAYENATAFTYSNGYLSFGQDSTYYLTVTVGDDAASLTAMTNSSDAVTWDYSATTGFSCEVDDITYYLSSTGIQTTPPSHVILGRLKDANTYVLGYGSRSSTLVMTETGDSNSTNSSATQYQVTEADSASNTASATLSDFNLSNSKLDADQTYTYTVSYTVTEDDIDLLLTNTVTLSYSYQSEYSSAVQAGSSAAAASLTILSFSMNDIVIDYGLPVEMDYESNCTSHGITLTEEGASASFGTVTVAGNVVTYTLNRQLTEADVVTVYNTAGGYYTFNVYPATEIYYEEDFGTTDTYGGLVNYANSSAARSWTKVYQDTNGTDAKASDSTDGSYTDSSGTSVTINDTSTRTQETGVVADDTDSVYGSDTAYQNDAYDSGYHSMAVFGAESSAYGGFSDTTDTHKPAAFRYQFTGTGTTIYGRVTTDTAYIMVRVTDVETGTVKSTNYIDTRDTSNYTNAEDIESAWDVSGKTLYSIPIYDTQGLDYGTYKVYVYVYKEDTTVKGLYDSDDTLIEGSDKSGGAFYLDGIRIYNPAGTSTSDSDGYAACSEAYKEDGESDAVTMNIRDKLVNDANNTASFTTLTDVNGSFTSLDDYSYIGPDNELYLYQGAAGETSSYIRLEDYYYKSGDSYYPVYYQVAAGTNTTSTGSDGTTQVTTVPYSATLYYYTASDSTPYVQITDNGSNVTLKATATTENGTTKWTYSTTETASLYKATDSYTASSSLTYTGLGLKAETTTGKTKLSGYYTSDGDPIYYKITSSSETTEDVTTTTYTAALYYRHTDWSTQKVTYSAYTTGSGDDAGQVTVQATATGENGTLTDVTDSTATLYTCTTSYTETTVNYTALTAQSTLSFYILNWNSNAYKLYLGMKNPDGTGSTAAVCDNSVSLKSSVDLYYDVTSKIETKTVSIDDSTSTVNAAKVTVTSASGLVSLTNIKVLGASGFSIANQASTAEETVLNSAALGMVCFASTEADWIEEVDTAQTGSEETGSTEGTDGGENTGSDDVTDNTGDDQNQESGNVTDSDNDDQNQGFGNVTDNTDNDQIAGSDTATDNTDDDQNTGSENLTDDTNSDQNTGSETVTEDNEADNTDGDMESTGSESTDENPATDGGEQSSGSDSSGDGDSSAVNSGGTENLTQQNVQIRSVRASVKNGKTTLTITTGTNVTSVLVQGKKAVLKKAGKNKNVYTITLAKKYRGKTVKVKASDASGGSVSKKVYIPKNLNVSAKYTKKSGKTVVTVRTSKDVRNLTVNGKEASKKKTANGYVYTVKLKDMKKGTTVRIEAGRKNGIKSAVYTARVK